MFPLACEGAGFEASGSDVDLGGGDGVEESVVHGGQPPLRGDAHPRGEAEDPPRGVKEADPGGFLIVLLGGGDNEAADELVG